VCGIYTQEVAVKNEIKGHAEQAYNSSQILARNCIERTIGILQRRFPALKYGLRLKLSNTLPVIVATVVVHNIAVTLGEDEPADDDDELQQYVAEKRLQLLADKSRGNQSANADIDPITRQLLACVEL